MSFKSRLIDLLKVTEGEWLRLVPLGILYFLLMAGWSIGSAGCVGIFINEVGPDRLPFMYILNALVFVVASTVYSRAVEIISRKKFFVLQLAGFGLCLFILRILIPFEFSWIPYFLYSLSEIIYLVLISFQFWTFANFVFNPREGKRMFPILGSAGLFGVMAGGIATKPIVSVIGTENILLLWSIILVSIIPVITWADKNLVSIGIVKRVETTRNDQVDEQGFLSNLSYMWSMPLMRTLAYLSLPMLIAIHLVDYQFFHAISEIFVDKDQVTGFLGFFNGFISAIAIILQFLFTGKLLQRYGIGLTLLIHPLSLAVGSIFLLFRNLFTSTAYGSILSFRATSAMFAKITDEAVYKSVGESTFELLFNATPEEKREQSRAFIVGIMEPVSTIIAGIILIIFTTKLNISLIGLSIMSICSCFFWTTLALKIKSNYLDALAINLGSNSIELRNKAIDELGQMNDSKIAEFLVKSVSSSDNETAVFAVELLGKTKEIKIIRQLVHSLPKFGPKIQIVILRMLLKHGNKKDVSLLYPLLKNDEDRVRALAVKVIGKLGDFQDLKFLEGLIDDPNINVRSEAIISLFNWNLNQGKSSIREEEILVQMAKSSKDLIRAKAAYMIGEIKLKTLIPILLDLANSKIPAIQRGAIKACGKLNDESVIPQLVNMIEQNRYLQDTTDAILSLGEVAIKPLQQHLLLTKYSEETRISLIKCLGEICSPQSIAFLVNLLKDQPIGIENAAVNALANVKAKFHTPTHPGSQKKRFDNYLTDEVLKKFSEAFVLMIEEQKQDHIYINSLKQLGDSDAITLLVDGLQRMSDTREETLLDCLELNSESTAVRTVKRKLKSVHQRKRAEAIEILESTCDEIKELIQYLETKYLFRNAHTTILDPEYVFNELLKRGQQSWILACSIYAIGELKLRSFADQLLQLQNEQILLNIVLKQFKEMQSEQTNLGIGNIAAQMIPMTAADRNLSKDPVFKHNLSIALQKLGEQEYEYFDQKEAVKLESNIQKMLFLRTVPLFADVNSSDLQFIHTITSEQDYSIGEILFEENESGDSMFIIRSGSVKVVTGKEPEITLAVLGKRDCFGEMAIVDDTTRSATAVVEQDVRLLVITRDDFHELLISRPDIAFSLCRNLINRLRSRSSNILEFARIHSTSEAQLPDKDILAM